MTIIVGDYTAQNPESYLAKLDRLSAERKDGGMLHGGHIHFIQQKLSDEDGVTFLKAAISMILDRVPSVFPYDLPELVDKAGDDGLAFTAEQTAALREIQSGLILPIDGCDVLRVILAAREYEKEA